MSKDEIIKQLRDMAKHPTVTLPRDCEALRAAADLLSQSEQEYKRGYADAMNWKVQNHLEHLQPKVRTGDCLLTGVCASEGHKIQPKEPEQEPVAYRSRMRNRDGQVITGWVVHLETTENPDPRVEIEPLYTTPPQRTWVWLTWNDIPEEWVGNVAFMEGAKWADRQLKAKNNG